MLAKLLSLAGTAKGAAIAAVVVGAAATTGVVATNPDVQQAVQQTVQQVTGNAPSCVAHDGQPAIVTARNGADKKLRDAFQDDQTALAKFHSTKVDSASRATLDTLLNDADAKLRARLTKALNEVAAMTLGREGLATNSTSPSSDTAAAPCDRGANVAFTDQTGLNTMVQTAIDDMKKFVDDTTITVNGLPTVDPGKPADAGAAKTTPEHPTPPSR